MTYYFEKKNTVFRNVRIGPSRAVEAHGPM